MSCMEEQTVSPEQVAPIDDYTAWCRDQLFTPDDRSD